MQYLDLNFKNNSDHLSQLNNNSCFSSFANQNNLIHSKKFYNQTNLSLNDFSSDNNIEASTSYKKFSNMNQWEQINSFHDNIKNNSTYSECNINSTKSDQSNRQQVCGKIQFCNKTESFKTGQSTKVFKFSEIIESSANNLTNEKIVEKSKQPSTIKEYNFTLKLPDETRNNSIETENNKLNFISSLSNTTILRNKRKNEESLNSDQSVKKSFLDLTKSDSLEKGLMQSCVLGKSKSNRTTLSDILLEDDERIDGSVKLEWVFLLFKY